VNPEQRALLLAAKLKSLVTNADESLGWRRAASGEWSAELEPAPFQAGAGLIDPVAKVGWLLVAPKATPEVHIDNVPDDTLDPNPRGWLGGAIVWGARRELMHVHVLLDHVGPFDVLRTKCLTNGPTLWQVSGRTITAPTVVEAESPIVSEDHLEKFSALITDAGAEVVVDHGVVRAEVLGLEVGRVTVDETGATQLEVGVGRHDRLANAMLGHDRDIAASLTNAVGSVASRRTHVSGTHPANQLARERWLRCIVRDQPSLVNVPGPLHSIESVRPATLKQLDPALLFGDGVIVACSVGVDLDAAIDAAVVRSQLAPDARLLLVLPEHDVFDAHRVVVSSIPRAEIVTVPDSWMAL
jgi:hypothetical protein